MNEKQNQISWIKRHMVFIILHNTRNGWKYFLNVRSDQIQMLKLALPELIAS